MPATTTPSAAPGANGTTPHGTAPGPALNGPSNGPSDGAPDGAALAPAPGEHACLWCGTPHQRGRGGWQRNYCSWKCMRRANGLPEHLASTGAGAGTGTGRRKAGAKPPSASASVSGTGSLTSMPPELAAVAKAPAKAPAATGQAPAADPPPVPLDALDLAWLLLRSATYRALPAAAAKAIVREALATHPVTSPTTSAPCGAVPAA